jgi:hypothetical protein
VLYANTPLKAAVKGVKELLEHLKTCDGMGDAAQFMIPMMERNRITNFDFYRELETLFKA